MGFSKISPKPKKGMLLANPFIICLGEGVRCLLKPVNAVLSIFTSPAWTRRRLK
jgi:hypothetical protein